MEKTKSEENDAFRIFLHGKDLTEENDEFLHISI